MLKILGELKFPSDKQKLTDPKLAQQLEDAAIATARQLGVPEDVPIDVPATGSQSANKVIVAQYDNFEPFICTRGVHLEYAFNMMRFLCGDNSRQVTDFTKKEVTEKFLSVGKTFTITRSTEELSEYKSNFDPNRDYIDIELFDLDNIHSEINKCDQFILDLYSKNHCWLITFMRGAKSQLPNDTFLGKMIPLMFTEGLEFFKLNGSYKNLRDIYRKYKSNVYAERLQGITNSKINDPQAYKRLSDEFNNLFEVTSKLDDLSREDVELVKSYKKKLEAQRVKLSVKPSSWSTHIGTLSY